MALTPENPSQLQPGEIVGVIAKSDGLTTHQEATIIDHDACVTKAYINQEGVSKTKKNREEKLVVVEQDLPGLKKKRQVLEGYVYQIMMSEGIGRCVTLTIWKNPLPSNPPPPPLAPG